MECGIRNKVLGYHRHIAQQMMINYGKVEGVPDDHQDCMTPCKFENVINCKIVFLI